MEKSPAGSAIFGVDRAMHASVQEIIEGWKSDFPQHFPGLVKTMLSSEGLKKYSEEDRKKLFASSLEAFNTLPWSHNKGPYHSKQAPNYINASRMWFDEKGEISHHKGMEVEAFTLQKNNLLYTDIACLLLLGMSLNSEEATVSILNLCINADKNKRQTLIKAFSAVLSKTTSLTRKWIKDNRLDASIGGNWDSRIAELLFNLPEFRIDAQKGTPKKLPSITTGDAPKLYSEEAFDVFLEYVLQYTQGLIKWMDPKREEDLVDFMLMVKQELPEYAERPSTQLYLQTINDILDTKKEPQQEERQGKLLHIGDVLPNVPPNTQWFRVRRIIQ